MGRGASISGDFIPETVALGPRAHPRNGNFVFVKFVLWEGLNFMVIEVRQVSCTTLDLLIEVIFAEKSVQSEIEVHLRSAMVKERKRRASEQQQTPTWRAEPKPFLAVVPNVRPWPKLGASFGLIEKIIRTLRCAKEAAIMHDSLSESQFIECCDFLVIVSQVVAAGARDECLRERRRLN